MPKFFPPNKPYSIYDCVECPQPWFRKMFFFSQQEKDKFMRKQKLAEEKKAKQKGYKAGHIAKSLAAAGGGDVTNSTESTSVVAVSPGDVTSTAKPTSDAAEDVASQTNDVPNVDSLSIDENAPSS